MDPSLIDKNYDDLLDRIYDAALNPAGWAGVLESRNGMLNSRGFGLFFQDRTSVRFNQFVGLDSSDVAAYENHFGAVNPWAPAFARQPDKIAAHELMGPDTLERTEFYNDWLNPLGLHDAIGIPIRCGDDGIFLASGLRDKKAGYYTADEERLARRITPHMKRAIEDPRAPAGGAIHARRSGAGDGQARHRRAFARRRLPHSFRQSRGGNGSEAR